MPRKSEEFTKRDAAGFLGKVRPKGLPDIRPKVKYKKVGKKSRLTIKSWLFTVFRANELIDKDRKMTDRDIKECLEREFPQIPRNPKWWKHRDRASVNRMRQLYNRGKYSDNERPKYLSFRYDSQGRRVNFQTGTRLLTRAEYDAYVERYDQYWIRKNGFLRQNADEIIAEFDDIDNPEQEGI